LLSWRTTRVQKLLTQAEWQALWHALWHTQAEWHAL
jgi:hypothetical protein